MIDRHNGDLQNQRQQDGLKRLRIGGEDEQPGDEALGIQVFERSAEVEETWGGSSPKRRRSVWAETNVVGHDEQTTVSHAVNRGAEIIQ